MNMSLYREISAEVMSRIRPTRTRLKYTDRRILFQHGHIEHKGPAVLLQDHKKGHMGEIPYPCVCRHSPTKTLCKMATEYAKKNEETGGVFDGQVEIQGYVLHVH